MQTDGSLTFVVLTYNHADFVLEHLESVAYLIRKFAQTGTHDLIVSDDASEDSTVLEVSRWLDENKNLFRNVATYFGSDNIGTCKSFLRATENIRTAYVKVTGGDDLFSDEDIFSEMQRWGDAHIIGSQPLILIDNAFRRFHKFNLVYALANSVYSDKPLREQIVGHGCIFTPGLIYSTALITDARVRDFICKFILVEDLPSFISIAEHYPVVKFRLSSANLVYYRRTSESAYLIAGSRVFSDDLECRKYLLKTEKSAVNRLLIRNRIWLMTSCPPKLKNFFDIGRAVFVLKLMFHLPSAIKNIILLFFVDQGRHARHYNRIRENVAYFRRIGF